MIQFGAVHSVDACQQSPILYFLLSPEENHFEKENRSSLLTDHTLNHPLKVPNHWQITHSRTFFTPPPIFLSSDHSLSRNKRLYKRFKYCHKFRSVFPLDDYCYNWCPGIFITFGSRSQVFAWEEHWANRRISFEEHSPFQGTTSRWMETPCYTCSGAPASPRQGDWKRHPVWRWWNTTKLSERSVYASLANFFPAVGKFVTLFKDGESVSPFSQSQRGLFLFIHCCSPRIMHTRNLVIRTSARPFHSVCILLRFFFS